MDMIVRQIQANATQDKASHDIPVHTDACTTLQRVPDLEIHNSSDHQNLYQEQISNWSARTTGLAAKDTEGQALATWWIELLHRWLYIRLQKGEDHIRDDHIRDDSDSSDLPEVDNPMDTTEEQQ